MENRLYCHYINFCPCEPFYFAVYIGVELLDGGYVINGATKYSFSPTPTRSFLFFFFKNIYVKKGKNNLHGAYIGVVMTMKSTL